MIDKNDARCWIGDLFHFKCRVLQAHISVYHIILCDTSLSLNMRHHLRRQQYTADELLSTYRLTVQREYRRIALSLSPNAQFIRLDFPQVHTTNDNTSEGSSVSRISSISSTSSSTTSPRPVGHLLCAVRTASPRRPTHYCEQPQSLHVCGTHYACSPRVVHPVAGSSNTVRDDRRDDWQN